MHRIHPRALSITVLAAAVAALTAASALADSEVTDDRGQAASLLAQAADQQARSDERKGSAAAGERVRQLLASVATAGSGKDRIAAATELAKLGGDPASALPALKDHLARTRSAGEAERRSVLEAIGADIPDKKGKFSQGTRKDQKNQRDDFDWLAALAELDPGTPALGEVMADVAAIRALAATRQMPAADVILDFAFTDDGMLYRDECGRYLRQMAPYSLPALTRAAENSKGSAARRRYASYQLERLDRRLPDRALEHASMDESITLALFEVYAETKPREAVVPVLNAIADPSPRVRQAARQAWLAYVTGPEPPPAPKRRLVLPGGKLSDEEEPLWLTYRELADVELRRTYETIFGDKPPRKAVLEELSKELFAHHDAQLAIQLAEQYRQAAALAKVGDLAGAIQAYERILAQDPAHPERAAMASTYFDHGQALEREQKWSEAAAAYSTAHGLAPEGEHAAKALAGHHFAVGKALETAGKDGTGALRRAATLDPGRSEAASAAILGRDPDAARGRWMLYAGLGSGAGALILLIVGFVLRRR